MECPLHRLQTNMCHVCSIIVSVLLIMDLYHLMNPFAAEKPSADRKIQHKALTQQRGGRRRRQPKQKSTRTQLSGRRSHQNAELRQRLKDPSKSTHWRTHKRKKTKQNKTPTRTQYVCAYTETYQHCLLKRRLDHLQIFQAPSENP